MMLLNRKVTTTQSVHYEIMCAITEIVFQLNPNLFGLYKCMKQFL